ncbi:MAG: hypothetical protein EHM89_00175 [Acidobacteria bacterium]|nr:MAG: hypothetical protein EHM89_00175 [Acidobacteriota bacterium]
MTEREAIEAILVHWEDEWEALHPEDTSDPDCVPWYAGNEAHETSELGALGAWARINVIHTAAEQTTMGSAPSRKFERRGNIYVQLFAPIDAGVQLRAELADDVRTAMEGFRVDELRTYAGRTEEGVEDGVWSMAVVIVPFAYTDTR